MCTIPKWVVCDIVLTTLPFTIQQLFQLFKAQGTSGWCSISWTCPTNIAAAQHSAATNRNPGATVQKGGMKKASFIDFHASTLAKNSQFLRKKM
jgi:hypothetical protein